MRPIQDDRPSLAPLWRAALWMMGSILSFSAIAIASRMVKHRHDTFEILTYRSLIGVVLVVGIATATGQLHRIRARRLHAHVLRNAVHFSGQALWLYAILSIPLAQAVALEFTSPLWVVLAAPLFLGERLTLAKLAAALIGLAGVMIVAQPDFSHIEAGVLAGFSAALFFAAYVALTARRAAEAFGMDYADFARATTANFDRLFARARPGAAA